MNRIAPDFQKFLIDLSGRLEALNALYEKQRFGKDFKKSVVVFPRYLDALNSPNEKRHPGDDDRKNIGVFLGNLEDLDSRFEELQDRKDGKKRIAVFPKHLNANFKRVELVYQIHPDFTGNKQVVNAITATVEMVATNHRYTSVTREQYLGQAEAPSSTDTSSPVSREVFQRYRKSNN